MQHAQHSLDKGFDDLGYGFAPAQNKAAHPVPEIALWCAVLERAFIDVGLVVPNTASKGALARGHEYDEAVRFLLRDNKHFFYVCSLAGMNPAVVRQGAMRIEQVGAG